MKKYELTTNTKMCFGRKLYQIKALKDFGDVKAGDLGGYIEKEENLSHDGNAWVFDNSCVLCNAYVFDNARVYDNALIYDNAWISGDARASDDAWVSGNARISGNACVYDNALIYDNAWISGNAWVSDDALVSGNARISGNAWVSDDALVSGDADYICFKGFGSVNRNTTMFKTKNGDIYVCCGCFKGSLKEFEEKVKETHGNTKYAKEYLACIEVAKIHFEIDEQLYK